MVAEVLASMPAVELFDVKAAPDMDARDYPFTSAFYESMAFAPYKKRHFTDLIVPRTMREAMSIEGSALRQFVLWDARFLSD